MHVGGAGGGRGAVGEQPGDDLDRHPGADQRGGVGVAQHVQRELDAAALPQPGDELVHRLVVQRLAVRCRPQVDEHVVRVEIAVLVVHVRRIQPGQRHRDRDRRHRPGLGARPVGVVDPGHDADRQFAGDEVAVPQPERLADTHPGLGQQPDQQPVAQMGAGGQDRGDLVGLQGARHPGRHDQPDRPGRHRPGLADVMQQRLVAATVAAPPRHQLRPDPTPSRAWKS